MLAQRTIALALRLAETPTGEALVREQRMTGGMASNIRRLCAIETRLQLD
jgi:hypothetical protein